MLLNLWEDYTGLTNFGNFTVGKMRVVLHATEKSLMKCILNWQSKDHSCLLLRNWPGHQQKLLISHHQSTMCQDFSQQKYNDSLKFKNVFKATFSNKVFLLSYIHFRHRANYCPLGRLCIVYIITHIHWEIKLFCN